ncbi:hypothetical protein H1R20_g9365, partial [Candolleomyces eurysporus]
MNPGRCHGAHGATGANEELEGPWQYIRQPNMSRPIWQAPGSRSLPCTLPLRFVADLKPSGLNDP